MKKIMLCLCALLLVTGCVFHEEEPPEEVIPEEKTQEEKPVIVEKKPSYKATLNYDYEHLDLASLVQQVCQEFQVDQSGLYFFYENYVTKETYAYQDDVWFMGASTMKVPLNMFVLDLMEQGKLNEQSQFYFYPECLEGGDGKTAETYMQKSYIPVTYLMEQSIVYSDNTATNILLSNLGYTKFKEYFKSFYTQTYPADFASYNVENARLMHAVLNCLYENQENYQSLLNNMKQSSYGGYLKEYLDVEVAHKYGNYDIYRHDFGIVFAKQPYAIGIFTEYGDIGVEFIAHLSLAVYEYTMIHA